eukprot:5945560-Pyramimonas_sp.AAC.2
MKPVSTKSFSPEASGAEAEPDALANRTFSRPSTIYDDVQDCEGALRLVRTDTAFGDLRPPRLPSPSRADTLRRTSSVASFLDTTDESPQASKPTSEYGDAVATQESWAEFLPSMSCDGPAEDHPQEEEPQVVASPSPEPS